MSSYRPMSVLDAGQIIAPEIGLSWSDNRREVVDYLNRYRNLLYNRYERQSLFDSVYHCFCPQLFRNACGTDSCDRCYYGITLPREMAGVVNAWSWTAPLRVRDAWREAFTGLAPSGGAFGDLTEVREHFPTERDLQTAGSLQVYAESLLDEGKEMIVEVTTTDNRREKIAFILSGDGVVSKVDLIVKEIHSVLLPADRRGYITLSNADGYELSVYSPGENNVPAYKRYKLSGKCHHNLLVQGTRQFVEVYFDTDIIEIGDRMVLEFFGTYFKYYKSRDQSEKIKAAESLANAWANLDGLISRDEGARLPQPNIYPRPGCGKLPGYTRFYSQRNYPLV
jgi:hypothetical protein